MQYAPYIRPRRIDLRVNRPFAHGAAFACVSVHALAVEIDDNQLFGIQSSPANWARLDQNSFLVEPGAEMPAKPISRRLHRVEYPARLHQLFTQARFTKASLTNARLMKSGFRVWRLRVHLHLGLHQFPRAFV